MRSLSKEHIAKLAAAATTRETPQLVNQIRELRDSMSLSELEVHFNLCRATLCRIIKKNNIILSPKGQSRAYIKQKECSLGKIPWNKGKSLSSSIKKKISESLCGSRNYRYKNPPTELEKEKARLTYKSRGIHIMRTKLKSPAGREWLNRATAWIRTPAGKERLSRIISEKIKNGELKQHRYYKQGWYISPKAGKIYYRSSYELRYYHILDSDQSVLTYEPEPFIINYNYNGLLLNYIPDILIKYRNGANKLCEIKPARLATFPKVLAKINAACKYCGEHNLEFVLVTEEDLNIKDTA